MSASINESAGHLGAEWSRRISCAPERYRLGRRFPSGSRFREARVRLFHIADISHSRARVFEPSRGIIVKRRERDLPPLGIGRTGRIQAEKGRLQKAGAAPAEVAAQKIPRVFEHQDIPDFMPILVAGRKRILQAAHTASYDEPEYALRHDSAKWPGARSF